MRLAQVSVVLLNWISMGPVRRAAWSYAFIAAAVYFAMPASELTFDNAFIIGDDTRLRNMSVESLAQIMTRDYWWPSMSSTAYRPLTTASFWFEYSFLGYGASPLGYQLGNAVLHVINATLLFVLGRVLGLRLGVSFAVGAIFCLHPLGTEAVANIVGRSDLFALAGVLGGLLCYLNSLHRENLWERNGLIFFSGLIGLAGVMSKENAIILPVIIGWHGLLGIGEWMRGGDARAKWLRDAFAVGLAMVPSVVFFIAARRYFTAFPGAGEVPFIDNPLVGQGLLVSKLTAMGVWGMQLAAVFAPLSLSSDYSFDAIPMALWPLGNSTSVWGWCTIVLFVIVAWVIWRTRKAGVGPAFCFGAYTIAMLPTSNVLLEIGSIRADRFNYLPMAFLLLGVAFAARDVSSRWGHDKPTNDPGMREQLLRFGQVSVAIWAVCLAVIAHVRCYDWRSNLTLWSSAVSAAPGSVKSRGALSNESVRVSADPATVNEAIIRSRAALADYQARRTDKADWPLPLYSDLTAFHLELQNHYKQNDPVLAERHAKEALEWAEAGMAISEHVRRRWATRWQEGDIEKAPIYEPLLKNYVLALLLQNRAADALAVVDTLTEMVPFSPDGRGLRMRVLTRAGRPRDAALEGLLAIVLRPEDDSVTPGVVAVLREVFPEDDVVTKAPTGNERIKLDSPLVRELLAEALATYKDMLTKHGLAFDAARVERMARYVYHLKDQ